MTNDLSAKLGWFIKKMTLHYLHYLHFGRGKCRKCRKCNAKKWYKKVHDHIDHIDRFWGETVKTVRTVRTKNVRETMRLWEADCRNRILSREGTIISYLALLERLFPAKQTKKEPACSVAEQAGVPIDRVIGGLRERVLIALWVSVGLVSPTAFPFRIAKSRKSSRSMLFYFLTCEGVCFVAADDEDLTVDEDLCTLYIVTLYIL